MSARHTDEEIENALGAGDANALSRMLGEGLDANWTGAGGQTLLHWAARLGDTAFAGSLIEAGARKEARNEDAETPRDVAVAWGHGALADLLMPSAPGTMPCASLAEVRERSRETGVDYFHYLTQAGFFPGLAALAVADGEGFDAADLLARGADGDTALMKICQQGHLPLLAQPALWLKKPEEFQKLWEKVPMHYRNQVDHDSFMSQLRQARLQSYGKPKLKGFKK